ncbi:MAG: prolyl oligopeptidase family serine peptidase [Erysipelotrichaceae bacterium]|nr:prolyl oligopeptidase family serine peptidase [Erysipelotrichaceae bacterium]
MNMLRRYQKVEKLMPYNTRKLVLNLKPDAHFEGNKVVYGSQYFSKGEVKTRIIERDLSSGKTKVRRQKEAKQEPYHPERSLDKTSDQGTYTLFTLDNNLILRNNRTKKEYQLTDDGSPDRIYGLEFPVGAFTHFKKRNIRTSALFSHDGRKALVPVLVFKNVGTLTLTQVFNDESTTEPFHPKTMSYRDWFPFEQDADCLVELAVVDLAGKQVRILPHGSFFVDKPLSGYCRWDEDDKGFLFGESDRYCKRKALYHVSYDDLSMKKLYEETTDTFFQDNSLHGSIYAGFGYPVCFLKDGKSAIVISYPEDKHSLYFYDTENLKLGKRITDDDVYVSNLLRVDEDEQIIYFTGSSLSCFSDPYYGALCSIRFDGSDFRVLTPEDGMHHVKISDDGTWYVDTFSRIDDPGQTVLGNLKTGEMEVLVKADISKLLKAGYILPKPTHEVVDGMDLYGCIVLPDDYDENKKYPVIDYVYGGPQRINTPKDFECYGEIEGREGLGGLEGFAKLGFIGVIIDGRGTPHRGKKTHDISYQNLQGCDGLEDHIPFMRKLSEKYKGMDLTRVGIWGNSAGGYASTRAMLLYPDFYKAAVSSAGDHCNSIYNAPWAYRYQGPYDKDVYLAQDSAQLVENFRGHLLLCHGLLDDNVHPSETFRMIQYFNKANKDVDLMVLPDTDHNCPANVYFQKRRFDYFVRHLLHQDPPENFRFSKQQ